MTALTFDIPPEVTGTQGAGEAHTFGCVVSPAVSTDETLTLDIPHELVERIAVRVAELLSEQGPADSDPLLSAQEAASRVGVHVETIRRAIREGRLEASKAGSAIRIAPDDLSRWITAPEARVTAPRRRRGRTGNALADGLAANNC